MLRRKGLSVLEAADGHSAVDLFRANNSVIGVVLLDLTLPGMGGKDVLAEMQRIRPGVRVILTTAYSREMAVKTLGAQNSAQNGARNGWAFIRKPYRINELVKLLREVLST
jgi:DNA-binding NtrC family response regulator